VRGLGANLANNFAEASAACEPPQIAAVVTKLVRAKRKKYRGFMTGGCTLLRILQETFVNFLTTAFCSIGHSIVRCWRSNPVQVDAFVFELGASLAKHFAEAKAAKVVIRIAVVVSQLVRAELKEFRGSTTGGGALLCIIQKPLANCMPTTTGCCIGHKIVRCWGRPNLVHVEAIVLDLDASLANYLAQAFAVQGTPRIASAITKFVRAKRKEYRGFISTGGCTLLRTLQETFVKLPTATTLCSIGHTIVRGWRPNLVHVVAIVVNHGANLANYFAEAFAA
jgi:hypothetical protein